MPRLSKSKKKGGRRAPKAPTADFPVVFISHATTDDIQVQRIAADLRERKISTFCYPFDTGGARVETGFRGEAARPKVLLFAVSSTVLESPKLRQAFDDTVNKVHEHQADLRQIYILRLTDVDPLPAALDRHKVLDLQRGYGKVVDRLVADLTGTVGRPAPVRRDTANGRPGRYNVAGTFDAARPGVELFEELQRQLAEGRLDQRYLYWETQSALRWQRAAESSTYLTAQRSMNLLVEKVQAIVDRISADGDTPSVYSFINFGVGTGQKDFQVLRQLLQRAQHVMYYPIDDSFEMIRLTMKYLQNLLSVNHERVSTYFIVDDFFQIDRFTDEIEDFESDVLEELGLAEVIDAPTRVIGLLGGAIGNFDEVRILDTVKHLMTAKDYLLVGVEYIAGRSEDQLIENYSDRLNKEFLYGPIGDLEGWPDYDELDSYFNYDCGFRPERSRVPDSKTITVQIGNNGHKIEVSSSTKYDPDALRSFLEENGFKIVEIFTTQESPPVYGKYLLKLITDEA